MQVPTPGLLVSRSNPEGVGLKSTKGRRSRLVPLAERVLDIVADLSVGKGPTDLLCTTDQATALHPTAVVRTLAWEKTAGGVAGSMTSATPRRACGWRVASIPGRSRPGSVTSRSRRRTATCTSSGRRLIGRVWSASISRGATKG